MYITRRKKKGNLKKIPEMLVSDQQVTENQL